MRKELAVLLLFVGCSKATVVERAPLALNGPTPIKTKPLEFSIQTVEMCPAMDPKVEDGVLFCMTASNVKNLSDNLREITNFIILQKRTLDLYRWYYEDEKIPK